ncbi:MAG: hypothetical protein OXC40_05135 [Proteobacteria bacterium]|nr:hypothetical protein [Pseudomonadota bacterium]
MACLDPSLRPPGCQPVNLRCLNKRFPDNSTARNWFEEQRWGVNLQHIECPRCHSNKINFVLNHNPAPYRCRGCRSFFSVKVGTIMQSSHLDYRTWAIALSLWWSSSKKLSSMQMHRDLGVTQKSAWFLLNKLKLSCSLCGSLFSSTIQCEPY